MKIKFNYLKIKKSVPLGMKKRLSDKCSELVTNCNQLKMKSPKDGKNYKTDVADTEQLLRIIQSIPSPKADLNAVVTNIIEAIAEEKTEN